MTRFANWENIITEVTQAMRVAMGESMTAAKMDALMEFREFRLFRFRAGRQIGKTTGIMNLVRKSEGCAVYDQFTSAVYTSTAVPGGDRQLTKMASEVNAEAAFNCVLELAPHTLFLSTCGGDTLALFEKFYIENSSKFPNDFIVVVEE